MFITFKTQKNEIFRQTQISNFLSNDDADFFGTEKEEEISALMTLGVDV
jgi:hypothetical protein